MYSPVETSPSSFIFTSDGALVKTISGDVNRTVGAAPRGRPWFVYCKVSVVIREFVI
jgi:hypothetical protein